MFDTLIFKSIHVQKDKVKFVHSDTETGESQDTFLDFDNAMFEDVRSILQTVSLIMLCFEEVISDKVLISQGFSYQLWGDDIIPANEFKRDFYNNEKIEAKIILKGRGETELLRADRLAQRLQIKAISINESSETITVKSEKYRNGASLQRNEENTDLYTPSDKFTKVTYPAINYADIYAAKFKGEYFPFGVELKSQVDDLKGIANMVLLRKLSGYTAIVREALTAQEIKQEVLNLREGEAMSDSEVKETEKELQESF